MKRILFAAFVTLLAASADAQPATAFALVNAVDGGTVAMNPTDGRLKVVFFTRNSCPAAKAVEPRLMEIANRFNNSGVTFYAVDPIDDETLAAMKARADEQEYPFPYLKDAHGSIARAYGARVIPSVYVIDGDGTLRYHGYIDDAERKHTALIDALNALTNGRDVANATEAFGCAIR